MDIIRLQNIALSVRKDILKMSTIAQSAHSGGALSCVEILVALYFDVAKTYPKNPSSPNRDRIVFSKAHDAKALYSVLAHRGFFSKKVLDTYEQNGSILAGHSTKGVVPGVDASTGSLGHGLSIASGMALGLLMKRNKARVFVVLSDGECDEGSTWEAALFASHHKLSNLTIIIDYNKLQGFGFTKNVLNLEPFEVKWRAFGFETSHVDGHDFRLLSTQLKNIKSNQPKVIIAHTTKGLGGISKYENTVDSQYKSPTIEEYNEWLKKL